MLVTVLSGSKGVRGLSTKKSKKLKKSLKILTVMSYHNSQVSTRLFYCKHRVTPDTKYKSLTEIWILHCVLSYCVSFSRFFFYIHGSVHRDTKLIRSNKMQQYAGIYLLHIYSTCFGCPSHPSSGERKTLTAASDRGHSNNIATTFLRRGLIRPRWRKVVAQVLWPVSEAAEIVFCTPDDGWDGHPKHVE